MLRVMGGRKRFCDRLTRRELLQLGSLACAGLPLVASPGAVRAAQRPRRYHRQTCPASARRSRASCFSCTARPASSRRSIPSPTPRGDPRRAGLHSVERAGPEHLRAAAAAGPGDGQGHADPIGDRTLIRFMASPTRRPAIPRIELADGAQPARPGALAVHRLGRRSCRGTRHGPAPTAGRPVPRNLVLPWAFSSQRVGEVARAGPYGGFLGPGVRPDLHRVRRAGDTKGRARR